MRRGGHSVLRAGRGGAETGPQATRRRGGKLPPLFWQAFAHAQEGPGAPGSGQQLMLLGAAVAPATTPPGGGGWMQVYLQLQSVSPTSCHAMNQDPSRGEAALRAVVAVERLGEPVGQVQTSCDGNFENVELGVIGKKKKIPRRVIHFVSGETMEEYSTDEDESDGQEKRDLLPTIDPPN